MTVPGIGPIIASAMVATIGDGSVFRRGRDFGLVSCRDRSRPAIETSLAVFPSAGTVIFARSLCRRLGSYSCARPTGPSTASAAGCRLPRGACITTSWQRRSPTSSPALPGACCTTVVAMSLGSVLSSPEEPTSNASTIAGRKKKTAPKGLGSRSRRSVRSRCGRPNRSGRSRPAIPVRGFYWRRSTAGQHRSAHTRCKCAWQPH
jgi:hypothetical protein